METSKIPAVLSSPSLVCVAEWMKDFQTVVPDYPQIPEWETRKLCYLLMMEELVEAANSMGIQVNFDWSDITRQDDWCSLVGLVDGLADLEVTMRYTQNSHGLKDDLGAFAEVMRSNWTKMWTTDEIVENDVKNKPGWSFTAFTLDSDVEKRYVVRDENHKIKKSPSYEKAQLEAYVR